MVEVQDSSTKRFGTIAVEEGFITQEQLMAAMAAQVEENVAGEDHRLIGVILYEMGFMEAPQIKIVVNGLIRASSFAT